MRLRSLRRKPSLSASMTATSDTWDAVGFTRLASCASFMVIRLTCLPVRVHDRHQRHLRRAAGAVVFHTISNLHCILTCSALFLFQSSLFCGTASHHEHRKMRNDTGAEQRRPRARCAVSVSVLVLVCVLVLVLVYVCVCLCV